MKLIIFAIEHSVVCQLWSRFKEEIHRFPPRGVTSLPSDNAEITQIFGWEGGGLHPGSRLPHPVGRDQVTPVKATTGKQDSCLPPPLLSIP